MTQYIQIPLPLPDTTVKIPLTQGHFAIVDAIDADLCAFNWNSHKEYKKYYALRHNPRGSKKSKIIRMHRVILERKLGRALVYGEKVDHISGDSLDNRRCNLRVANDSENNCNRSVQSNSSSGIKDVFWHPRAKKWQVSVSLDGKQHYFGVYISKEEAEMVARDARKRLHGEFAHD